MVEEPSAKQSWWVRLRQSKAEWIIAVVILLGLGAIAAALSDSVVVGRWFAGALCALLIVILAMSALTLRVLRTFLSRTRIHLQSAVRHGLANLYRPGNQSAAVLAALGTGVMLILTVFLMQHGVIGEMKLTSGPNLPNIFLVDISSKELDGVKHLLAQQPAIEGDVETLPSVAGRIISVDGTAADGLKLKNYPQRLLQTVSLTWSRELPVGSNMAQGAWWDRDDGQSLAVSEHIAQRLHLASRFANCLHFQRKNHSRQSHRGHPSQWPARICAQRIHPHAAGSVGSPRGLVWCRACRPEAGRSRAEGAL